MVKYVIYKNSPMQTKPFNDDRCVDTDKLYLFFCVANSVGFSI